MSARRVLLSSLLLGGLAFASTPEAVTQAVHRVDVSAAKTPKPMERQFRAMAAKDLQGRYPDLAKTMVDPDAASAPAPAVARTGGAARPQPSPEAAAIQKSMGTLRSLPTDADRAQLVTQLTADIRALPAATERFSLASGLCNLSTEGDLGKPALDAAASTLAQALHDAPSASANSYIELASLVRYEHVAAPPADPALDAATAILELRDAIRQEAGFTLTAMDGKTYNLDALRGKVVLLNFWATWCPPCRREMPDMQKLYQRYAAKGLVVLGVSDEKRETVEAFLAKQSYTFPILLDPDRKVNTSYFIEGIPHSFLFDRQGKLVAQSIDMRTERQFLEMFKEAGLE
jgi:peroxiredoxin